MVGSILGVLGEAIVAAEKIATPIMGGLGESIAASEIATPIMGGLGESIAASEKIATPIKRVIATVKNKNKEETPQQLQKAILQSEGVLRPNSYFNVQNKEKLEELRGLLQQPTATGVVNKEAVKELQEEKKNATVIQRLDVLSSKVTALSQNNIQFKKIFDQQQTQLTTINTNVSEVKEMLAEDIERIDKFIERSEFADKERNAAGANAWAPLSRKKRNNPKGVVSGITEAVLTALALAIPYLISNWKEKGWGDKSRELGAEINSARRGLKEGIKKVDNNATVVEEESVASKLKNTVPTQTKEDLRLAGSSFNPNLAEEFGGERKVTPINVQKKPVNKISEKAAKLLDFCSKLKVVAKLAKYATILGFILSFADPMILAIQASVSGNPSWDEVRTSFIKSLGSFFMGWGGSLLGAAIGNAFLPVFGTIAGAILAGYYGSEAGEYLAEQLWLMITEDKSGDDVLKEAGQKALEKVNNITPTQKIASKVADVAGGLTGGGGADYNPNAAAATTNDIPTQKVASKVADVVGGLTGGGGADYNPNAAAATTNGSAGGVTKIPDVKATGKGKAGTVSTDEAISFFKSKGWTNEQAAGIVGNLMEESGSKLSANSLGDNGQAYGIAQWHPNRQADFKKQYGKDIRESTTQEQLAFVDWELNNTHKSAGAQLKKAKTAEEAAIAVDNLYEISAGSRKGIHTARVNNAASLFASIKDKPLNKENKETQISGSGVTLATEAPKKPSASPSPSAVTSVAPPAATEPAPPQQAPVVVVADGKKQQQLPPESIQSGIPSPAAPYYEEDSLASYFNLNSGGLSQGLSFG